jgi:hypothetical protein
MKTITVTLKFEFESEEVDHESIKEALTVAFEELVDNDELLEKAKIKVVEQESDEDEDPDFEDDED